ncbi:MAG: hypothetical protein H6745_04710 [Deltaproteobacteria bacterium]|nr:hypothetical protein [Deltaproteobacteria bacterium]
MTTTLTLVGPTPRPLGRPVRAARFAQLAPLLGVRDDDAGAWPVAVAAWLALTHHAPRVVVAGGLEALDDGDDTALIVAPGPRDAAARRALWEGRGDTRAPLLLAWAPDVDAEEIALAGERNATFWAPGGTFRAPGPPRGLPVCGASIAAALIAGDVRAVDRFVDLAAQHGVLPSGVRVLEPAGDGRARLPEGAPTPYVAARPTPGGGGAGAADDPLPSLTRALEALKERVAFRGAPGAAAVAALRREAEQLLRAEAAKGRVTAWALEVGVPEDAPEDVIIEARVRLPRRVDQVVVRVGRLE